MKLTKQDVWVWVKASDELPEAHNTIYFRHIEGEAIRDDYGFWDGTRFCSKRFSGFFGLSFIKGIEWLKPVKGVYVLTKDELEEIVESEKEY